MKTKFKRVQNSDYDPRITAIKDYISTDGSEQQLSYLVSPKAVWENSDAFIAALNLFGEPVQSTDLMETPVLFAKMLDTFNTRSPDDILLRPLYESVQPVLSTDWNCEAVMWEEAHNYYAVVCCTTA